VDLGVTHLAVLSCPVPGVSDADGFVPNPRYLGRAQRALRRASRRVSRRVGPDRRAGQRPSKRWEKADRRRNTVHHWVTNLRRDGLHKLTTGLATTIGIVVVEDLNVAGMLQNRKLARQLADASFGEIRRQLCYKMCWSGGRQRQVAQSGWETINGRGADRKTKSGLAGGAEASTPHRLAGQDGDRSLVTASCE